MIRRALLAGTAVVAAALPVVGGGIDLIPGEADALGLKFWYDTDVTKQMRVVTASVAVDSDPFASLVYTSPSIKLCQQSDQVWRYGNHNLCSQSQTLGTTWATNQSSVSADAGVAPDGTTTADKIIPSAVSSSGHRIDSGDILVAPPAGPFQMQASAFVKAAGYDFAFVGITDNVAYAVHSYFDLQNGVWTSDATPLLTETVLSKSIESVGNGWYLIKCVINFPSGVTASSLKCRIGVASLGTGAAFTGDGTSGALAWGAKLCRYPVQEPSGLASYTGFATTTAIKVALPYEWLAGVAQGIKPETARTNRILRSQELDSVSWTKGTETAVTANATTAPDGTTTADKIRETGTGVNLHQVTQSVTITAGDTVTISAFLKSEERTRFSMYLENGADWRGVSFDLSAVSSSPTSTGGSNLAIVANSTFITAVGNGWYRCGFTCTTAVLTTVQQTIRLNNGVSDNYVGVVGSGAYAWGAQAEVGANASSPIHTTSATITRAVDDIKLATSAYPHSDSVGTLIVSGKVPYTPSLGTYKVLASIADGTTNERHALYVETGAATVTYNVKDGGVQVVNVTAANSIAASTIFKAAFAYTLNDSNYCLDAGVPVPDTSCTMPTVTTLRIGADYDGSLVCDCYIREISYFKRRMTNGELNEYTDANVAIGTYEDETWSFLARTATTQVAARKTVYNTLFAALKTASILTKLDALWCFDAAQSTTALKNLISSSFTASPVNSPSFSADAGYTLTGGSNHRINTTFNPTTGGQKFAQNDACFFAWCNTAAPALVDGGKIIMSGHEAVGGLLNNNRLYCQSYPSGSFGEINGNNSSDADSGVTADARGLHLMTRLSSTVEAHHFNLNGGSSHASISQAAESDTFTFGAIQTNERFSGTILGGGIGKGLTPTEVAALYAALRAYHVSVAGISVP